MDKIITFDKIDCFAYTNKDAIACEVKGIVVWFFGLGHNKMIDPSDVENKYVKVAEEYAKHGVLYVFPYNNPWNWMNSRAVAYTDEVLDEIIWGMGLSDNIPIVAAGGSMGGQSALVYTRYAKRTPVACVVNCPVCDMPYHFTERRDLPRTLYSAFGDINTSMKEALLRVSPYHLVPEMPDIDYYHFHCDCDRAVNYGKHALPFVERMREAHRITFHTEQGRGHCDLSEETWGRFHRCVLDSIEKKKDK